MWKIFLQHDLLIRFTSEVVQQYSPRPFYSITQTRGLFSQGEEKYFDVNIEELCVMVENILKKPLTRVVARTS